MGIRRLLQLFGCSAGAAYKQSQRAALAVYQLAYKFLKEKTDALLANDQAGLALEYSKLQDAEVHASADVAENSLNSTKNRYANVLPFDYNRVKISGEDDYINASIVQCPEAEAPAWRYIAAQGPLASTVVDFWKMVLESNCKVLIMLTRTIENNHIKCADYFSQQLGETLRFGDYRVTTTGAEEVTHDITKRTLHVKHHKTQQLQVVTHYHYHRWPDFGVPDSTEPIRRLVRLLWESDCQQAGGAVVHCSAGIGRTGTLMAIDVVLRRLWSMAQQEGPSVCEADVRGAIDLPAVVQCLRRQRKGMIQTMEQYYFCYEALLQEMQACMEQELGQEQGQGHGQAVNHTQQQHCNKR